MKILAHLLVALGVLVVVASVGWWWLTYGEVIQYDYISAREAGVCLVGDSDICRLARALCRGAHPTALIAYRAATFWVGVTAVSASMMLGGGRVNDPDNLGEAK